MNGWKEAEYAYAYSEMLGLKLKKVAESENSYNSFNGDPGNFMNYFSVNWLFGFMCLLCVLCLSVLLLQTGFKKRNLTSHWEIWQREEDTGAVTRQEAPRSCMCVLQKHLLAIFFFLIIVIEILSYCQGHSVCQIKMRLIRSQPQDFDGAMELHNILDLEIIKGITFICICVNTFPEFGHFFFSTSCCNMCEFKFQCLFSCVAELWSCVAQGGLLTSSSSLSGTTRLKNGKTRSQPFVSVEQLYERKA